MGKGKGKERGSGREKGREKKGKGGKGMRKRKRTGGKRKRIHKRKGKGKMKGRGRREKGGKTSFSSLGKGLILGKKINRGRSLNLKVETKNYCLHKNCLYFYFQELTGIWIRFFFP